MRFVQLSEAVPGFAEMQTLYSPFDIGLDGAPDPKWENRNLRVLRLDYPLKMTFFPEAWIHRVRVNRRISDALHRVLSEIAMRWTPEARDAHGLNQFVKCYCFGDGAMPSLFWYGAAWRLSEQVGGEVLTEAIKVFQRHGFTHVGIHDRRRLRDFEYW